MAKPGKSELFLGVDVGGTKIYAALVKKAGRIVGRARRPTPRNAAPEVVVSAIIQTVDDVLAKKDVKPKFISAIGLAIPGVVDPDAGLIVEAPNVNLSGQDIVAPMEEHFNVPVAMGNDVNLGMLGEKWLGAAQLAQSAVGIFVGTGIGGGVIVDGKLVRGARESAGEIGHMILQINGPQCGCGNKGCLEALASRSAIERDIRAAVAAGRRTILKRITRGDLSTIRSSMLKRALNRNDTLTTEVVRKAAEYLGLACINIRHVLDPDVIVLGGGVIEACGDDILPIVQKVVEGDVLKGARPGGRVVRSALGDDAVALGAASLAQELVGRTPLEDILKELPNYPNITYTSFGEVAIGKRVYKMDIFIRGDGRVKKRDKAAVKKQYGTSHKIGPEELDKVCKGNPEVLIIAAGHTGLCALTAEGEEFLRSRGIAFQTLPSPRAIRAYNRVRSRKAVIVHVTC